MSLRVLVTGATGFLGSRAVQALTADGHDVVALVRAQTASKPASVAHLRRGHVEIRVGDVLDAASVREAADAVDVVCHLAGALPRERSRGFELIRANVTGGNNVLEACIEQSVDRLVFASSVAVYGPALVGVTEGTAPRPAGPYGYSKLVVERAIRTRAGRAGLAYSLLRLAPVYGRGGPPELTRQVRRILAGQKPSRPLGGWLEQWIHVDDAARAVVTAATTDVERPVTFNIAGPDTVSPRQLAGLVWSLVAGAPLMAYDHDGFTSAVPLFDTTRSRAVLGFVPRVGLVDGLPDLIDESAAARLG
jgi:nucleoside-diphosphate-sugar epimerase